MQSSVFGFPRLRLLTRTSERLVLEIVPGCISWPRTEFSRPEYVHTQHAEVVRMVERIHPKPAGLLADAKDDLLAFTGFPRAHWQQIWSTNPLGRLSREIKRRTNGVGVFPNPEALSRLMTAVLMEQHDE
jgi:putative transposase